MPGCPPPSLLLLSLLLLLLPLLLSSTATAAAAIPGCSPSFNCGNLSDIHYPFWLLPDAPRTHLPSDYCGYPGFNITCHDETPILTLPSGNYTVLDIDYATTTISLADADALHGSSTACPTVHHNLTLGPDGPFSYDDAADANLTFCFNCSGETEDTYWNIPCLDGSGENRLYVFTEDAVRWCTEACARVVVAPVMRGALLEGAGALLAEVLRRGFKLKWWSSWGPYNCTRCEKSGGLCGYNASSGPAGEFTCFCAHGSGGNQCGGHCGYDSNNPDDHTCFCSNSTVLGSCSSGKSNNFAKWFGVGAGVGAGGFILASTLCVLWFRRKKREQFIASSALVGSASSKPFSGTSVANYKTHLFSYAELEEATDCFDASRELGRGGFGTVYKGMLRDGRVVAVKRLYENNYKRVEQFKNEIAILSRLRHQNLVTLYGCTSHQRRQLLLVYDEYVPNGTVANNRHGARAMHRSRELLLVYEYVPNGTVADHLHGARAPDGALDWPVRLRIAIETADALSYLHAVDPPIIHRDVKTNNILLDAGFRVKVADFGLSRLFPTDATHVSTAPQGTPGYLDPEYHQCYQLTDKSDVYSFGVVLVELISSKPAVDITRHRHEINLAAMAITKIQNGKFEQLVDPALGYDANCNVRRMIVQVTELAFRCLQAERKMRPAIREVVEVLRHIESGGIDAEADALMNKNVAPFSPDSVTERRPSRSTTPN